MMNISLIEILVAHIHYWINFIKMVIVIRRTYENAISVLIKVLKQKFPVDVILKNGKCFSLRTFNAMFFIAYSQNIQNIKYNVNDDIVIISHLQSITNKEIKFHGGVNNGDIVYGFLKDDYGKLPVVGKTVVDIGANIADTPIYFATHGAKKVICLEPFPKNYEFAMKNILLNHLSDKITLILAGCSSQLGQIIIDPEYESNIESQLERSDDGITVPLLTLEEIIKRYDIPEGSILKMDCEGCEYESIMATSDIILKKFSHIQIEYHSGYRNLKEKLENCGFKLKISPPKATDVINTYLELFQKFNHSKNKRKKGNFGENISNSNPKRQHKVGYCGFIYGTR